MQIPQLPTSHRQWLTTSRSSVCSSVFFFFQAEDGIRDYKVTGVQTCALPIYLAIAVNRPVNGCDRCVGHPNHRIDGVEESDVHVTWTRGVSTMLSRNVRPKVDRKSVV